MKELLSKIKKEFKTELLDVHIYNQQRVYIKINKDNLLKIADYFYNKLKLRFVIATGMDIQEGMQIIYHFSDDRQTGCLFNLKVLLPHKKPKVESLCQVFAGAEWIEREMHELLGIDFLHHPNLVRLLLSEDWPKGKYPLRKDYKK